MIFHAQASLEIAFSFLFFGLQTFMNCGMATMIVHLLQKFSGDWATLLLGWVTASVHYWCVSDGFALALVDRNPFSALFFFIALKSNIGAVALGQSNRTSTAYLVQQPVKLGQVFSIATCGGQTQR